MAENLIEKAKQELAKSEAAKAFKSVIDALDELLEKSSKEVATGEEFRDIECIWSKNIDDRKMELIRMDTGEIVEERELDPDEWQEEIDLGDEEELSTQEIFDREVERLQPAFDAIGDAVDAIYDHAESEGGEADYSHQDSAESFEQIDEQNNPLTAGESGRKKRR